MNRAAAGRASGLQVGIDAVAVLADVAAGQRAAVDRHQHLAAGRLGHGASTAGTRALCAPVKPPERSCAPLL
jgi:hypothetical protein